MASRVQYRGKGDITISAAKWLQITGEVVSATTFNAANGWSIDESTLTPRQKAYLSRRRFFQGGMPDSNRVATDIQKIPTGGMAEEAVLALLPAGLSSALKAKGDWNSSTEYTAGDLVVKSGVRYLAKKTNTNVEPVVNSAGGIAPTIGAVIHNSMNVPSPAWSQAVTVGSLMVVVYTCWGGAGGEPTGGWTAAGGWVAGSSVQQKMYYKIATTAETTLSGSFPGQGGNYTVHAVEVKNVGASPLIDYVSGATDNDTEAYSGRSVVGHQGGPPTGYTQHATFVNNGLYGSISSKSTAAGDTVTATGGLQMLIVSGPGDNSWEKFAAVPA